MLLTSNEKGSIIKVEKKEVNTMKKLFSRILLFTLIFAMLLQPLAGAVSAKETDKTDALNDNYIYHQLNPIDGGTRSRTAKTVAQAAVTPAVNANTYTSMSAAGKYVRKLMVNRETEISFVLKTTQYFDDWYDFTDAMHEAAFVHTGVPKEGDSLRWQWYTWSLSPYTDYENGYYYYYVDYTYDYRTTAAQEAKVDTAVKNLLNQLNLDGLTDYKKVYKIYEWITANVTYDYYNLQYNPKYKLMYSTYGAIIDRTCVCQGYALLFYRLALEVGIDARLVAGDGGGPHGWNIVKLGNYYYNLDSTWDAGYGPSSWDWFLLNDANFVRHYRDDGSNYDIPYSSAEFYKKYPMGKTNYDPNQKVSAPTLKVANVASTGKIKLSWNKISNATSYEIYRATSKTGTYTKLSTVTGTSVINSKVDAGKTYYYKIRAVGSNGKSSFSNIVSRTCDLPSPAVTVGNVASTGKNKISWKAVDGAVKYQVYYATSKTGTYSLLKTTTATSLTHGGAVVGKTYYYKVRAIHSNTGANSAFSDPIGRMCDLAQPKAQIKLNSKGKPLIYWGAVKGAVEYKVYIYDVNGKLLKTATLTNVKITHTSAVKGNTYKYRVVAIHSNSAANSAKSNLVSIRSK